MQNATEVAAAINFRGNIQELMYTKKVQYRVDYVQNSGKVKKII